MANTLSLLPMLRDPNSIVRFQTTLPSAPAGEFAVLAPQFSRTRH